ncbi:MAG: arylamine N-acetyltransferase [Crocinitomicaceae bacterium]|nr:arylamine N-acetyltransferase [Crocinitomicaceae bacterium]
MTEQQLLHYCKRIGFDKKAIPNYATLAEIQQKHCAAIPFENLNPLLELPVDLRLDKIFEKIVHGGRGGYCFEQNLLLLEALKQIGFTVRGLLGRAGNDENSAGRTHLILLVHLDGEDYIVDVGYGGFVPTAPLLLHTEMAQKTPNEDFRILKKEHEYRMEINIFGKWRRLYEFDLQHQKHMDYEVANWYTATSPESRFTQMPIIAIANTDSRYTLTGQNFTIYSRHQQSKKVALKTLDEVRDVLERYFKINLSELKGFDRLGGKVYEMHSRAVDRAQMK